MPVTTAAIMAVSAGCGKKDAAANSEVPEVDATIVMLDEPGYAEHLGFATKVPGDADFYIAGYHADEAVRGLVDGMLWSGIAKTTVIGKGDSTEEEAEPTEQDKFLEAMPYVGDEAFLYVGPGAGEKLRMIGTSYRDLSAAWAGFAVGTMLKLVENKDAEPDFSGLSEGLSNDLLEKWMETIEKDSQLQIPSVVMGWKPAPEKHDECLDSLIRSLGEMWVDEPAISNVDFEMGGVALKGFEFSGRDAFAELITEAREEIAKAANGDAIMKQISPERLERLLVALENMRITLAAGSVDGRVLLYLGNGKEGFRLAKNPRESLAACKALQWTREFAGVRTAGLVYLSEPMVRAALPWLDTSDYWKALSGAVRPPIREERLFRELLDELAQTDHELATRDAQPWSALWLSDGGIRIESSGGWPDPSLDYTTPLRMTDAADSQKPAIRAHWMQNRERNDLEWKQIECFGHLLDMTIQEFQANEGSGMEMIPAGLLPRVMKEIRESNRAYREEFRAGIGDEVVLIADLQGEVPPFPGISEETVKDAKAPRFLIARPVTDRKRVDEAGKSFVGVWKNLSEFTAEQLGGSQAAILPQSIESGGLTTWFPPIPFIGGDFVPGVTLNDELWMLGTSRSMAADFSKAMASSGQGGETGMIVEVDFEAMRVWFEDIYQRNEAEAGDLAEAVPEEMREVADKESMEKAAGALKRLQGLSYRKWMADGSPRSSFRLKIAPAE